jgi:hypothetical protein
LTAKRIRRSAFKILSKEVAAMGRRRYGSGGIRQRAEGRWEGALWLADGSRRSICGRNRDQLVAQLQEERWRIANGIATKATGLTLGQYLPERLEACRGRLRPKTFDSDALCAHRVELELGRVPLVRLNAMIIQSASTRLGAGGLSPRTVFQTHLIAALSRSQITLHRDRELAKEGAVTGSLRTPPAGSEFVLGRTAAVTGGRRSN